MIVVRAPDHPIEEGWLRTPIYHPIERAPICVFAHH
jgi:hypothetical protein